MKNIKLKGLVVAFLLVGMTHSVNANTQNSEQVYQSADDFLQYQLSNLKHRNIEKEIESQARLQALAFYAKDVAIQASIRNEIKAISKTISENSRKLDAIYDFQPLMIKGVVVPPVVTEANSLYNQSGHMQVRLTDKVYDIVQQAHISSTPPNWRNYLQFSTGKDDDLSVLINNISLKPQTNLELQTWTNSTKEGWKLGKQQAHFILNESMDRLNRDYIGMVRFHQLVLEGKLSIPALTTYNLYDNTDGNRLAVGEKLLQITSLPQFKIVKNQPLITQAATDPAVVEKHKQNNPILNQEQKLKEQNPPVIIQEVHKALATVAEVSTLSDDDIERAKKDLRVDSIPSDKPAEDQKVVSSEASTPVVEDDKTVGEVVATVEPIETPAQTHSHTDSEEIAPKTVEPTVIATNPTTESNVPPNDVVVTEINPPAEKEVAETATVVHTIAALPESGSDKVTPVLAPKDLVAKPTSQKKAKGKKGKNKKVNEPIVTTPAVQNGLPTVYSTNTITTFIELVGDTHTPTTQTEVEQNKQQDQKDKITENTNPYVSVKYTFVDKQQDKKQTSSAETQQP